MIETFANKQPKALWETGKSKIDTRHHSRILRRLDALDAATRPEDMNLPGFGFHALRGHKPTRYTVHVNGPWCVTFEFGDGNAYALDLEQCHQETNMSRDADRCPTHPGELLRKDVLPAVKKSKTEVSRLLGISRQHLHDILAERKPVSPEVAVRLGKLFGNRASLWIRMQGAYDEWQVSKKVDVSGIPTLHAAE